MTAPGDMKLEMAEPPLVIESQTGAPALGWSRLLQVLLLGLTIAGVVVGVRIVVPGGMNPVNAVAFGLTIVWALVGFIDTHARDRSGTKVSPYHLLAGLDALVAMVALTAGRQAATVHASNVARDIATLAAVLVTAISFHFLLALPDGRLHDSLRRGTALVVYVAAAGVGIGLVVAHHPFTVVDGAISWTIAAVLALGPMRARYLPSIGYRRERMLWLGIGVTLAITVALAASVLHLLVGWPASLGAVAAAGTVLVPLGLLASESRSLAPHGSRGLVQVLAIFGFVAVVSAIYLVLVLGLGHAPKTTGDKEVLALSMIASGVAAVIFVPVRERFLQSSTRFVYGAREAPDEVLRTFGSRLTRAIPMDELLLQLAESLRKTMALVSAEVYTGAGEVLERTVSVPDVGPGSIVVSARERPVVTRAGVSGTAWASIWLPALLAGREKEQIRVAPVSHAGELLGLIVVERSAQASAFSEDDDRVLSDLARQVGLALHNSQLDTALQTTLDEVRKQAEELRQSRARIVASGDAERRRIERNLHDGAQQHLVALAVNLRLARDIITDDTDAGLEMLDQLADEVQETIQEVRQLAHGIYPPLLVDSGLVEALRAAANRNPLPVEISADGIGRYPSETEAAVYFCCLEALQNAAKHAPDAHVDLHLWEEAGGLLFTVADDGPGFDPDRAQKGHGYVNMADRLGAIGGTVRWESEIGTGSVVVGSVPLV
ncbi:MAG TPA: histidine kinase [Acidimicrobiales bacterium]|nr:histidine kinase [Acidimicrobiales bacterium]